MENTRRYLPVALLPGRTFLCSSLERNYTCTHNNVPRQLVLPNDGEENKPLLALRYCVAQVGRSETHSGPHFPHGVFLYFTANLELPAKPSQHKSYISKV